MYTEIIQCCSLNKNIRILPTLKRKGLCAVSVTARSTITVLKTNVAGVHTKNINVTATSDMN